MNSKEQPQPTDPTTEREKLEARLSAAKAARAAASLLEAPRIELELLRQQTEDEEQALEDDAAIAAIERQKGDAINRSTGMGTKLAVVRAPRGKHGPARLVLFSSPDPVIFKRYQDQDSTSVEEIEKLVRPCRLYPESSKLDAVIDEFPGLLLTCADTVAYLAGARLRKIGGK